MTIYKYISNEKYLFDILKKHALYFNSFRDYNDPYEIFTFIHNTNDNKDYVMRDYKDQIKACCFSQTNREYLLWAHYAKSHQGFCVEFQFDNLSTVSEMENINKITLENNDVYFFPIRYEGPYQLNVDLNRPLKKFSFAEIIDSVSHKYKFWSYEKEYRMVVYSKKPCRIYFPKYAIKGVTYGVLVSNKNVSYLNKMIRKLGYNIPTKRLGLESNLGLLV